MGRVCRICCRERPNEQFGGKGYGASVCKRCRKKPKAEQQLILATDEVLGYLLEQSNISAKNIKRLDGLVTIDNERFQKLRCLVLEIAHVKPHKRRRWSFLRMQHPKLYRQAAGAGLARDFGAEEPPPLETEYDGIAELYDPDQGDPRHIDPCNLQPGLRDCDCIPAESEPLANCDSVREGDFRCQ